MIKINASSALNKIRKLENIPQAAVDLGYQKFLETTPVRTGNARRNTKENKKNIEADYPYAGPLDSRAHMSEEAIRVIKQEIQRQIKGR
jgi:hypothetical protein